MSKLRAHLLWPIVMLVSLVAFCGVVFADAPADPTADPQGALGQFWQAVTDKKWSVAAVIGAMLLVALVRFIAPKLHDKFGAWILTSRVSASLAFLSGMLMAIATQLMKGGALSMKLIAYGFRFGVLAIGGYNAFWDLLFPADKKAAPKMAIPAATPPPPVRPGVLLPLAFIGFALAVSCAHVSPNMKAFGTAYGACMEAKGLAVAPSVAEEAWNDLNNGSASATIVAQLEALAGKAGQDAVACAVQAWLGSPTTAARNPAGVEAAKQFLSKKTERRNRHAALSLPQGYRLWTGALGAS